jgi:hypothetical protein
MQSIALYTSKTTVETNTLREHTIMVAMHITWYRTSSSSLRRLARKVSEHVLGHDWFCGGNRIEYVAGAAKFSFSLLDEIGRSQHLVS